MEENWYVCAINIVYDYYKKNKVMSLFTRPLRRPPTPTAPPPFPAPERAIDSSEKLLKDKKEPSVSE